MGINYVFFKVDSIRLYLGSFVTLKSSKGLRSVEGEGSFTAFLCFSHNYDLASHSTNVMCVNFIRERRDLQFKVSSEQQIFFGDLGE